MSNFTSFVELLVKQTCRRASYEFEMGSKQSKDDSSSMYTLEFLKSLYEKPRDNIHKVVKISDNNLDRLRIINGYNWMCGSEFTKVERKLLLDFVNNVKEMSPTKAKQWIDLQHYMHYVYRNFANADPDPSAEVLSSFFVTEIKELIKSLMQEDECQLYLRILAILREYCIFAQWNYSKSIGEHRITKLFYYYEAMLSAAKNLSTAFSELEVILYKNYSVCWIDFNTCVFIRYFFETEYVQKKICQCLGTKISPGDTPGMFGLLEDLKNLWIKEQKRINKINEDAMLDETTQYYEIEESMIVAHKKVLTSNFWVERPRKEVDSISLNRLDHQIFRLLADPTFHPAGPILDRNGQCICEECLIAKYKCILDVSADLINEKILKSFKRLSYCRRCQNLVELNYFHRHINSHAVTDLDHNKSLLFNKSTNLSRIISEKIDFVKLSDGSSKFSDLLPKERANKKPTFNIPKSKEQLSKLANKHGVFRSSCDINCSKTNGEVKQDTDSNKVACEGFLKNRKENGTKHEHLLSKSVQNFIQIKKDIFNHTNGNLTGKVFDNVFKQTAQNPVIQKKNEPVRENDTKIREIRKNGHKPYPLSCKSTVAVKTNCEHNCKHEEETKNNTCPGHGTTCDHHKESKKCDCTYCEVFGTSVTSHTHKNNELRDRLRIRLHQRREKRTKDTCKAPATPPNANNSAKVKTVINKVEERVPLPSSPTNIPPAPSVKSSDSSITTSSATTDDIHGLVNYIEGNTALNKLELAEKKAAKKVRQRLKKEEKVKEEEEQKRLAEELKRNEAEKKEIARKQAEKEKIKLLNKAKYEARRKSKKERQAEKKQLAKQEKLKKLNVEKTSQQQVKSSQVLEETIPAMVTIKRTAENGSGTPTVTITLKGSTPDQDKLLYTLVSGNDENVPKKVENDNNQNATSKKKKKKKQQSNNQPTPKVITKELKVTLALDSNKKNATNTANTNQEPKKTKNSSKSNDSKNSANKPKDNKKEEQLQDDLQMPMLRLPPGITITKVEGPVSNRNYQVTNLENQKGSTINVGKSGVIVVDTEKLIQNKQNAEATQNKATKTNKKSRKKKNKKQSDTSLSTPSAQVNGNNKKMVTLKNPIFQPFQGKPEPSTIDKNIDGCAPAAIFTNENGMVTIRSSRLQQTLSNGGTQNVMPMMPMPNLMPEIHKAKVNQNSYMPTTHNSKEDKGDIISPFNAQAILSGLPGIEITKVDKNAKSDLEAKFCQPAQVSIIPASNGGEKFSFDKDDWLYDSVFSPRDVLEDDMDPDELELEAFKRFCQQSVPPKRKEKVAHLNVADIIVKKKTDVNFF